MATAIGFIGVLLLLLAFVLNLFKQWREDQAIYLACNVAGAALACIYAAMTGAIPFVILEGVWGLFALLKMAGFTSKKAPA